MSDYSQSLISLLAYHATVRPDAIALRHKKLGLWQNWSWKDLLGLSERYASALYEYGFQNKQTFLIVSAPNIEVVAISLAIQALGGEVQLIDQSVDTLETEDFLQHLAILKPDYILVERLEQLVSIETLRYHPIYIFYIEQSKLSTFEYDYVVAVDTLLKNSNEKYRIDFKTSQVEPAQIAFSFERIESNQRLRVQYSHQELIEEAKHLVQNHHLDHHEEAFVTRAFSSVGHIRYLWSSWLLAGFNLNIPETLNTRDQDRQIISPTLILGTNETYARVEQLIYNRLPNDTWLAKHYQHALQKQKNEEKLSWIDKFSFVLFKQVILEELGFSQLKVALIVGQPVTIATRNFYQSLGVELHDWGEYAEWQNTPLENHSLQSLPITTIN
ncbi:AMP-binding protein [Acinetobacter sp. XS-4]|uniref:AMP-binding protein n=1 Tax=Acinetobacter sp. XS-4 TaxID=2923375 RepID=UPI00208DEDBC|nr:AMP-binding protein [Acinetobacter sp. XS-4]USP42028.1 AMP-binding protein [Acinetobacter sp. XS-4]